MVYIPLDVAITAVANVILLLVLLYIYRKTARNIKQHIPKTILKTIFGLIAVVWVIWIIVWISEISDLASAFSTLTVSGIIGLAITLALQSTFSNILSGFSLVQENVLRIGDIITYGNIKGEVVKLTYRAVWIRTDNGEITIVSNSTLSAGPFTNHTATKRLTKNLALSFKIGKKIQETAEKIPHLND